MISNYYLCTHNIKNRMLQLNVDLFKDLAGALRMTYKEISSQSNISMTTLYRIIETPSKISVQQLIDLANGLRVPVSRFFSKDSKEAVGEREDYINFNHYKLCFYDKSAMQKVIDSNTVSSYREIASVVGLHPNRVKESLLAEHRLPVTRLLTFCDSLKIDFFNFVVDPNAISANARKQRNDLGNASEYAAILHDIESMLREQAIFRDEIRRDIARLDKKIDLFINANYEEFKDPDEVKHIAVRAKQAVKEIQNRAEKQLVKEKVESQSVV